MDNIKVGDILFWKDGNMSVTVISEPRQHTSSLTNTTKWIVEVWGMDGCVHIVTCQDLEKG